MESQSRQEPVSVSCPQCGTSVRRSNLARHLRLHQTPIAGPAPTYVLSVPMIEQQQLYLSPTDGRRSAASNTTSVAAAGMAAVATTTDTLTHQYSRAAWALLKQHDQYTEEDLWEFLATQYPGIPDDHRLALIHGATAGARIAAHLHFLLEGSRTGKDPASRMTAEGAQRSLSYWNLGLMTRNKNDPQPQAMVSPEVPAPTSPEALANVMIQAEIPQLLELPVSRGQSDREFDRAAHEEMRVDDLGLPAPSIELIDDQPVATQPDARHVDYTAKRDRDSSSGRGTEESARRAKVAHYMSVDERIEYELGREEEEPLLSRQRAGDRGPSTTRRAVTDSSGAANYHIPTIEPRRPSADRGVQPYIPRATSTATTATYNPTPITRPAHQGGDSAVRRRPESVAKTAIPPSSAASRPADETALGRREQLDQTAGREVQARSPRRVQRQTPCRPAVRLQTSRQPMARRHSASPRDRRPATSTRGPGDRDPYKGFRGHRYGDQR